VTAEDASRPIVSRRGCTRPRCACTLHLGAVKADAVGIAYAIERDWLIISGGFHSVSLTDAGGRRVK